MFRDRPKEELLCRLRHCHDHRRPMLAHCYRHCPGVHQKAEWLAHCYRHYPGVHQKLRQKLLRGEIRVKRFRDLHCQHLGTSYRALLE